MGLGIDFTRPRKPPPTPSYVPVPIQERVRRLPEAVLLTTGYYASRIPAVRELLQRLD
jgi:hypothetical protein